MQVFSRRNGSSDRGNETYTAERERERDRERDHDREGDGRAAIASLSRAQSFLRPRSGLPAGEPASEAVITSDITIEGNVRTERGLRLEGTVAGDVQGGSVTISEDGNVLGSIEGDTVEIYGRVSGTVRGRSVMLHRTARVEGDIIHQGIGMEMGTHYEGTLRWDRERGGDPTGLLQDTRPGERTVTSYVSMATEESAPRR
ncbi:MAG: hypothetical protein GC150_17705 [Rhizobiales bacterium]|nr:hypothetical protein [Hyphomicrobiales bacterium]